MCPLSLWRGFSRVDGDKHRPLHAVLSLSDYIYDDADEDAPIRMPGDPVNEAVPNGLETWRQRHEYYLSDPDLRLARAAHAWRVIWDNHDLAGDGIADGPIQSFREWMPVPIVDANQPTEAYRSVTLSGLAGLIRVDSNYYAKDDVLRESDASSMLGLETLPPCAGPALCPRWVLDE